MEIIEKKASGTTMRVPRSMRNALGDDFMMMVYGDIVLLTKREFEVEPTLKSLGVLMSMIATSSELQQEENPVRSRNQ